MSETGSRDTIATDRTDRDALLAYALSRWRIRLRRVSDIRPRSDERGESERILVSTLLRVIDEDDETALPGLAAAAARYGASPRDNRIDPGALCEEFAALRLIVWDLVKARKDERSVTRILRFDRALSIVIRAAVRAGYAPEEKKNLCQTEAAPNLPPGASARGESSSVE